MKRFIMLISAIILTEARNIQPGLEVFEILQDRNGGIKIRPVSANVNLKPKRAKSKFVDNSDVNFVDLLKLILSQSKDDNLSQLKYNNDHDDGGYVQGDIPLEESLFVDQTRGMIPQDNILLHLLAPNKLSKNRINILDRNFKPILRARGNDHTSAPVHRYIYADDN